MPFLFKKLLHLVFLFVKWKLHTCTKNAIFFLVLAPTEKHKRLIRKFKKLK
jgi:hypothetical protein